jgi:hypothetical protein
MQTLRTHKLTSKEKQTILSLRIFGLKRDEVMGEWRKLHDEELHNFYSFPDIIKQVKVNEVGGACGTHGRGEKIVLSFGGKV